MLLAPVATCCGLASARSLLSWRSWISAWSRRCFAWARRASASGHDTACVLMRPRELGTCCSAVFSAAGARRDVALCRECAAGSKRSAIMTPFMLVTYVRTLLFELRGTDCMLLLRWPDSRSAVPTDPVTRRTDASAPFPAKRTPYNGPKTNRGPSRPHRDTSTKHDDAAAAPKKNYETYPSPQSLRGGLLERLLLRFPLLLQFFELRLWQRLALVILGGHAVRVERFVRTVLEHVARVDPSGRLLGRGEGRR